MLTVKTTVEKTIANLRLVILPWEKSRLTVLHYMKYYTTIIRASVALAALAALVAFAPQANAALTKAQADSIKAAKTSKSGLLAAAKAIVAAATDKAQAARDVAALVATEAPGMANVIVGNLAKDNPAAAPGIAAAAAQANQNVAVAVARAAAAAAPAYAAQTTSQVSAVATGLSAEISAAVALGSTSNEQAQNTFINNPADVSTSSN
jgi:hypothetical protein